MPTYPVINKETKEKKTLNDNERIQWREDNPEWDKDWSQGCALHPRDGEVVRQT